MGSAAPPMSVNILFVCMGNICRSPALAATLEKLVKKQKIADRVYIDSCALTSWYLGCSADPRMCLAASKRGIQIDLTHRAKLFEEQFFQLFHYIFAVDKEVLALLHAFPLFEEEKKKIYLASAFSKKYRDQDIPDPYYGGEEGFELVMDQAEDCCRGIRSVRLSSAPNRDFT